MKIRTLTCAAVLLAGASGAQAADAIVIAEPEPMDYVRVCDIYGAGFFYIPGTETCLSIGGYVRTDLITDDAGRYALVRFAPTIQAKTQTELGTLTAFAELYFDYTRGQGVAAVGGVPAVVTGYGTVSALNFGYIELGDALKARLGVGETPSQRFLGYGGYTLSDGFYNAGYGVEFSLTYDFGNGLSIVAAAVEDEDADWAPDAEFGARYDIQGMENTWIGAIATYDESSGGWTGQLAAEAAIPNTPVTVKAIGFYSALGSSYAVTDPNGTPARWSALGAAAIAVSEKIALATTVQYFSTGGWFVAGNLAYTPVENLTITPELIYTTRSRSPAPWSGRIRVQRDF